MPFEIEDLFGEGVHETTQNIYEENKEFYNLFLTVKKDAYRMILELRPHSLNAREMLATCFIMRTLETSLGSVALLMRGLVPMAKAVARTIFEVMVHLKLIAEEKDYHEEFIEASEAKKAKSGEHKRCKPGSIMKEVYEEAPFEERKAFKKKLKSLKGVKTQSTELLARRAGLESYYDSVYFQFSDEVHSSVHALEKYLVFDDEGLPKTLQWSCDDRQEIPLMLVTIIGMLLHNMLCMNNIFSLDYEDKIASHDKRVQALRDKSVVTA